MNITPHTASLPIATVVNPATEGLRRENHQREIITQVVATNPSAAEKGVASDKERARTPTQANEAFDFVSLKKQAEETVTSISDQKNQQGSQQDDKQAQEEQKANTSITEHEHSEDNVQQDLADAKVINELQNRDNEVRAHELAHASTGGSLTGSPSYTFKVGPDGNKYAVSGEVSVDSSSVAGNPQATITKMQKVHAAALAPASPSSQDIKVAALASQKILEAQSQLLALNSGEDHQARTSNSQNTNNRATLDTTSDKDESNSFDTFINQTLSAQEAVTSGSKDQQLNTTTLQSTDVVQRASRIESFYFSISQGYEKPDNFQFELIA